MSHNKLQIPQHLVYLLQTEVVDWNSDFYKPFREQSGPACPLNSGRQLINFISYAFYE